MSTASPLCGSIHLENKESSLNPPPLNPPYSHRAPGGNALKGLTPPLTTPPTLPLRRHTPGEQTKNKQEIRKNNNNKTSSCLHLRPSFACESLFIPSGIWSVRTLPSTQYHRASHRGATIHHPGQDGTAVHTKEMRLPQADKQEDRAGCLWRCSGGQRRGERAG